jgi:hypothetical protein
MRATRLLTLAIAATLTLTSLHATAADDDPRKQRAEGVFKEGVKLHEAGKHEEALAKLREAYLIYPSPNTLGGIARVEQALGKKVDALHHYKEALKNPLMHPENATYAKKAIAELEAETAHVDVKGPPGLVVQIDGKEVALPLAEPVDTEPKTISLAAKAGDKEYVGSASCPAGTVTVIEMRVVQNNDGAAGTTLPPSGDAPRTFWTTGHTIGMIGWAGALLAGGAGAYFTMAANRNADDIDAIRARSANPDSSCVGVTNADCDARRESEDDRARNTNFAIASFVTSGVLLVGGTVAFFAWPSSRKTGMLAPSVTKTSVGFSFSKEF